MLLHSIISSSHLLIVHPILFDHILIISYNSARVHPIHHESIQFTMNPSDSINIRFQLIIFRQFHTIPPDPMSFDSIPSCNPIPPYLIIFALIAIDSIHFHLIKFDSTPFYLIPLNHIPSNFHASSKDFIWTERGKLSQLKIL